jgi:hypothetical protein
MTLSLTVTVKKKSRDDQPLKEKVKRRPTFERKSQEKHTCLFFEKEQNIFCLTIVLATTTDTLIFQERLFALSFQSR